MSRLQIFPPIATVYPNDRVKFTAKASPPPAMWTGVTNSGDIQSDFSLQVDGAQSFVGAVGAHQLFSGIGIVEWTIDDQLRPTSTGHFDIAGRIVDVNGGPYLYQIKIAPTTIEVRDELNNLLGSTISYSVVSGDVFRLEMSSGFRLYRNGALIHDRVNLPTAVIYPMTYSVALTEPTATAPSRIPAPRLIGDWRLGQIVAWTAPSVGLLTNVSTSLPSLSTEFSNATTPGTYTLTGAIEAAADANGVQKATATIIVPPLQILGPTEITLQPSQTVRFRTNYDAAQAKLITWSVVSGGGVFTQDEYTAPSTPGAAVVRATSSVNNQIVDIAITIPAVITNPSSFLAAKPSEQIDFATNIPTSQIPQLISGGSVVSGTGDITPTLPAGVQQGDILLIFVQTGNQAVSAPAGGYVQVADSPQGIGGAGDPGAVRLSVFWGRYNPGLVNPVIADPGDHAIAQVLSVRGCPISGDPWDVTAGDNGGVSASTSVSIPGDTTTVDNCLIVLAVAHATDTASAQVSGYTNASLSSLTERVDNSTTQGNGGGFAVATGGKATAGTYSATTATLATSSLQARMSIALKPRILTWSATIGSISTSTGLWTAPSLPGQIAKITATNGIFSVTIEIPVLAVFPLTDPILPLVWDRNLTSLISTSEDRRRRVTRDKSPSYDSYEVKFASRTLAESNSVDAFFDQHGFGALFILEDTVRGIRKVGWFDSAIHHAGGDEGAQDLSFRFMEARVG